MSKPTPGPWRFLEADDPNGEGNDCRPLTICGPNNEDLANVYSADDSTTSVSREQAIANARLISATPDMYAALKGVILGCRSEAALAKVIGEDVVREVKAALAKAEQVRS